MQSVKNTELIRTSCSWDGAALPAYPVGKPELSIRRLEFPAGVSLGWHHHPVINYGIVLQGDLTIICQDGTERTFHEGEVLVEMVNTIHRGENRGTRPVVLLMFYAAAEADEVTIQHPEIPIHHSHC